MLYMAVSTFTITVQPMSKGHVLSLIFQATNEKVSDLHPFLQPHLVTQGLEHRTEHSPPGLIIIVLCEKSCLFS
ncbi:hypothetical protein EXN66_Car015282 [Channa argus]|uniref:Uncharacterized protein n=1 Tax=Channa argus TaxID=215402 RepID=A0A6G1QAL8_CHAAH|nr:hypothetical protein EXN66_Car015282 [Channa argus]